MPETDEDRGLEEEGDSAATLSVPAEIREQLLAAIADRLSTGEILITSVHFQKAAVSAYAEITGNPATSEIEQELTAMVSEVNSSDPSYFVVPGIENWITRSALSEARRRGWGVTEIQEGGPQTLRQFVREPKAQALFAQLGVTPNQLNLRRCLRSITNAAAGKQAAPLKRAPVRLAHLPSATGGESAPGPPAGRPLEELLQGPAAAVSEDEAGTRTRQQKEEQTQLRQRHLAELMSHLEDYVKAGKLSAEEAGKLQEMNRVNRAAKEGKVSKDQASKIRNSLLTGQVRDRIEHKVKEAVDHIAAYEQVFQALRRIDPVYDDALRFLIRHWEGINADTGTSPDSPVLGPVVAALVEDIDTLHHLIDIMDRQDAEVRMLAARLPPYSYVMRWDQDHLESMVGREEFIDDLRQLPIEELSARLHSGDGGVRALPPAEMLCLASLLGRVIKPTPFRKEIRLLKINLIVEEFFRGTDDVEDARAKAQEFLRTRLRRLYPDITEEESAELQKRGDGIIEAAEQKVLSERRAQTEEDGDSGSEGGEGSGEDAGTQLTAAEEKSGVQIQRVAVRIAGSMRQVPHMVMPDDEDPARFVLARRDPETGEITPVKRRDAKRYVERNREGRWELARD